MVVAESRSPKYVATDIQCDPAFGIRRPQPEIIDRGGCACRAIVRL
jgi:hypothetical protein